MDIFHSIMFNYGWMDFKKMAGRNLKIGIICYPTFGGSGVIATELGTSLAKNGHEVHFITSSQPVKLNVFEKNIFFHEVVLNSYPLFQH